jgi:uracil-DNA glycosylase
MPVATDEIYEKYLQKAITEINELGHEVAGVAGGERVPVVGSGHPLADVFLLKYRPRGAELQEGVAFYGRTGKAILKSLQRLRVDPTAIYGTNCLKFAVQDESESRKASASGPITTISFGWTMCSSRASCTSSSRS